MLSFLAQLSSTTFSADQVISNYVYVFYAAFGVAFVFTPIMRIIALYYGVIDVPDKIRKLHTGPVAYLGGVAVFLGWLSGLTVSQFMILHRSEPGWGTDHPVVHFSIVIGALVIVVVGLWDDVHGVRPWVKIAGQIFAAILLLNDSIGIEASKPILLPFLSRLGQIVHPGYAASLPDWVIYGTSGLFVVGIVVGCCNASNLLDGLDGLCGGVTAIIAAGFLIVAVHLAMVGGGINTNWDALRVILGLALLGAVLGFIPFNFNPASIFMGDTGSMFLGYACATMVILMAQDRAKWLLASMVIFALPILDTTLAFARRWINRRPLFSADRQHFHHQLVTRGYTVKQTVLISYGLAVFFGILGIAMVYMRTRYAVALYMVIFGSIVVAAYKMGMVHERVDGAHAFTLGDTPEDAFSPAIEPGSVIEISDEKSDEVASASTVAGGWSESG